MSRFDQTAYDSTGTMELCLMTYSSSRGIAMGTRIYVSGLSYFCTDAALRQAFTPFGVVVVAQVLRDECGHALGTGVVHMARSEDVERVFNEHRRFEVSGSRVDLWEPAELEDLQGRRIVAYDLRERKATQTD